MGSYNMDDPIRFHGHRRASATQEFSAFATV